MRFLSEDYERHWRQALDACGPDPAERLWAMIAAEFDPHVCNVRYIAAWAALRAEANSRPSYQAISGQSDEAFEMTLAGLCREIIKQGEYPLDAGKIASGLASLTDGLGIGYLMQPDVFTERHGLACAQEHLIGLFPKHFSSDGPIWAG